MNGAERLRIIGWWALLSPAIALCLCAIPVSIYVFVADIWGGTSKLSTAMLLPGVVLFSIGIAFFFARRLVRETRKTSRRSRERRMPTCRRCGYCLTGNVSGICPECGTAWRAGPSMV